LKKQLTSFDIAAVISELKDKVEGGRIDNIYQLDKKTFVFKIKKREQQPINLLIEAGMRIHPTFHTFEKPARPPAFCMVLRKFLKNGILTEISQQEFERIIVLKIRTKLGIFQLIAELFGDGNIILVNPENRISHALMYKRMKDRNIMRGEQFQHAPSSGKNPIRISFEDFVKIRDFGELEVVKALTRFLSIGGLYAEEILLRAGINKNVSCAALNSEELKVLYDELEDLVHRVVNGELEPRIVFDEDGDLMDVVPLSLKKYEGYECKIFENFMEALDEYYVSMTLKEREKKFSIEAEEKIARLERILKSQSEALEKTKRKIEVKKKIGDLIYSHFHELQALLQRINSLLSSGEKWQKIQKTIENEKKAGVVPFSYVEAVDLKRRILELKIDDVKFSLNLKHSVQENAAKYYSEAKKAEDKLSGTKKAIEETKTEIEKLKKQLAKVEVEKRFEAPAKIRKRAWYEKFRWFFSTDNFLILGGKDATTNEILIKKYTEPQDIVFHADIAGAPFVVVKTDGKKVTEQTLMEAAQFAASFSKAWKMGISALDVYWVKPEQVSKTPPSGEFLRKGAFMIRGKKNYVRRVPLRVAIGIKVENDEILVIGGPLEAIKHHAKAYVELVPGDVASGTLAKKILQTLSKKLPKDLARRVLRLPLEEVQRFIPPGGARILED